MSDRTYTHRIELTTSEYADLLALVMKYGTGTGEGESSSIDLRKHLAEAYVIPGRPYAQPRGGYPRPVPVMEEGE